MNKLNYYDALKYLNIEHSYRKEEIFNTYYSEYDDSLFIEENELIELYEFLDIDKKYFDQFLNYYHQIINDKYENHLIKFACGCICKYNDPTDYIFAVETKIEKEYHSEFNLFILLCVANESIKKHKRLNIDECHRKFNLGSLKGYIHGFYKNNGKLGVELFAWCTNLASLALVKLNTLIFAHHTFYDNYIYLRNKTNKNDIVCLALSGINVRKDGCIDGVNNIYDFSFTTEYEETDEYYIGYEANKGYIKNNKIKVSKLEYEVAVKPLDKVIEIHIPSDEKLSLENSYKSYDLALEYFDKINDFDYKGFYVSTWLLSPQIQELLEPTKTSNIYKVFSEFKSFPSTIGDIDLYNFVFKNVDKNTKVEDLTPKTSLERLIVDFYKNGNKINVGTGVLFYKK